MAEVHDSGCGTVFGGGELSCVAVGEESHAGFYEGERMLAYFFADVDVLLLDAQGFIAQESADFGDGLAHCFLNDFFHAVQCP